MAAFAALSQKTRLDVFRLLVRAGAAGMRAGELSDELGVRQNTMSANLTVLRQANLITSEREGRAIRYFADFQTMRGVLAFVLEDCCGGNPDLCRPFVAATVCAPAPHQLPGEHGTSGLNTPTHKPV